MYKSTGLVFAGRLSIGVEPPATVLSDRSRFGNHGTFLSSGNPDWVRLPSGLWVMSFGGDDYVALPSGLYQAFASTDDFTILCWVDVADATPGSTEYFIGLVGDDANSRPGIGIGHSSAGNLQAFMRQDADNDSNTASFADTNYVGKWTLVTMKHDASDTNKVYLYLNGVEKHTDNTNSLTFATTDFGEGNIGAWGATGAAGDLFFNGDIAPPRFYKYLLSAGQIKKIFKEQRHWFGV